MQPNHLHVKLATQVYGAEFIHSEATSTKSCAKYFLVVEFSAGEL